MTVTINIVSVTDRGDRVPSCITLGTLTAYADA